MTRATAASRSATLPASAAVAGDAPVEGHVTVYSVGRALIRVCAGLRRYNSSAAAAMASLAVVTLLAVLASSRPCLGQDVTEVKVERTVTVDHQYYTLKLWKGNAEG